MYNNKEIEKNVKNDNVLNIIEENKKILISSNKNIERNIEKVEIIERGFFSQNILAQLRTFVESVMVYIYLDQNKDNLNVDDLYFAIKNGIEHSKKYYNLNFLNKFHKNLQAVASHYTYNEENSERLILKYYKYLLKIRIFLEETYSLKVLNNLEKFPIKNDTLSEQFYEKVIEMIQMPNNIKPQSPNRYYIEKVKPLYFKNRIYYEVTFSEAHDYNSKFNRIIAITDKEILENYAVKLYIREEIIEFLGKKMNVNIITDWEVAIRPCELKHLSFILKEEKNFSSNSSEYKELMTYLKETNTNLLDIVEYDKDSYSNLKNQIFQKANSLSIFRILDLCRDHIKKGTQGSNTLKYLLYNLKNTIIKKQKKLNDSLSLNISPGSLAFDHMPFNFSLISHNPKFTDVLECISVVNREYELFARYLKNNTEINSMIYTSLQEAEEKFINTKELIESYNTSLYEHFKEDMSIKELNKNLYVNKYNKQLLYIIKKLRSLSKEKINNYKNSVEEWLNRNAYIIDCGAKKNALLNMFENSKVCVIYGAAGTGKTTMINHIANFFRDKNKLFLAVTNTAVNNLKNKVNVNNSTFNTIAKTLSNKNISCDILIIDECSTVSNLDMYKLLSKIKFEVLVLVGDIYQIKSINFGNWFEIIKEFLDKHCILELTDTYRSQNKNLLEFWGKVREIKDDIIEDTVIKGYSKNISEEIFVQDSEDQIILCLNYSGIYGINNINRVLQSNNTGKEFKWGINIYKIGDPVIFNEVDRFSPIIYNNLKGKIVNIKKSEDKEIAFDIEVDLVLNELDIKNINNFDLEVVSSDSKKSVIRFSVYNIESDGDTEKKCIVPFQIGYAISIHKAQGLEYTCVKIVISDEIEDIIDYNIFYTAITRAKEKLRIYWSPETQNKIMNNLKRTKSIKHKDIIFLKQQILKS